MTKNLRSSFSLLEVLIFVSILSVFFVSAATITVVSLRNMKINEHKILATYYAQELMGWLRDEKDADWNAFVTKSATTPSYKTYCFKTTPISNWPVEGACGTDDWLSSIFKRELYLSANADDSQIYVRINLSWSELGIAYNVPLSTVFSIWE